MFRAEIVTQKEQFTQDDGRKLGESLVGKLGTPPNACWLFCPPVITLDAFLKGVADAVETSIIIGCTTDGEISDKGVSMDSAVLAGLVTDRIDFELVVVEDAGNDSEAAGRSLAHKFSSCIRYLQVFSDGITVNGSAILRGIISVTGKHVPICGGAAADGGRFVQTYQFAGNRVLTNAVVAVGFSGNFQVGTGIASGWVPIGLPKTVTHAEGNVVYALNNEPAVTVLERFLGEHAKDLPRVGVEYPLAIREPGQSPENDFTLFRATMSVDRKQGSIVFAGDIPEGATVWLTCGATESILDAAFQSAGSAMKNLGESKPVMIFCYSCMARKIVLGRHTGEEVRRVREIIDPNLPIIGFYSYGEYCPVKPNGPSMLHNETITLSIIGL